MRFLIVVFREIPSEKPEGKLFEYQGTLHDSRN